VQVATQPTASEFHGGIIGVTLRPVSGADFVSNITDEYLLHGVHWWFNFRLRSFLHSPDTWALHLALAQPVTWRIQGMLMEGTRTVVYWIRWQTTVQIATAGSRRPLLLRGHYCASGNPTNCQ